MHSQISLPSLNSHGSWKWSVLSMPYLHSSASDYKGSMRLDYECVMIA